MIPDAKVLAFSAWCAKRAIFGGGVTSFEDFGAWFDEHCADLESHDAAFMAWQAAYLDALDPDEESAAFEAWLTAQAE